VDGLVNFCPLGDYLAKVSAQPEFLLFDIGCAGGIDPQWRRLGCRLRAIGIDANAAEVSRLSTRERNPNITYLNGLAAIDPGHPFARKRQGRQDCDRNPWLRLSTAQCLELLHSARGQPASDKKGPSNAGRVAQPAFPEPAVFVVPEYLQQTGATSIDFLKIDVDGKDFELLHSFDQALSGLGVLGVGIEVNFFGSDSETDNSFHNVDRFLKARSFELFSLSARRYSMAALPRRFLAGPGPTEMGRILQGDALYARDLASGAYDDYANSLSAEKLLNLMAIFALFNLPDCAAELALKFRSLLSASSGVDYLLDLLTAQVEGTIFGRASYQRHASRFAQDPRSFYGSKKPRIRIGRTLRKEFLKLRGRMQLVRLERQGR
jgi:Methyltransferase FkbM domain